MTTVSVATSFAFALAGAAAGAVVALGIDQIRWRLAQSKRWDDQRRECYASFAVAAKLETRLCLRMAASLFTSNGPSVPPLEIASGRHLLDDAADHRAELFETVLLLGDQAVVDSARSWQENNRGLQDLLEHLTTSTECDFDEAFFDTGLSRDRFFAATRNHLGVSGDVSLATDWTWLGIDRR